MFLIEATVKRSRFPVIVTSKGASLVLRRHRIASVPIICLCSGPYAVTQACVTAVSRVFTPQHQYNQVFPLTLPYQAGLDYLTA